MEPSLTLVIGTRRYSSWSLRPWLALKAAGATFDVVEITLRQPESKASILAYSPSGKVPVLIHGALKIWESIAICEYVATLFPSADLWPREPGARAVARAVSAEMHAGFQALRSTCPMDVCVTTPLADPPAEVLADVERIEALWADCRSRFGSAGPFLFGTFGITDAMFAPVVTRFATYGLPLTDASRAYCDAVLNLPWMVEWRAAACP